MATGLGAYFTTLPLKGNLVVDLWYESSGHYPQSADQAVVYKAQLERTGLITVNLHAADYASFQNYMTEAGNMPVFMTGYSLPDYIDADDYFYPMLHSVGGSYYHDGYNSTEMDRLIGQERTTLNTTQRAQLFHQLQELSVQDTPMVPVFQSKAWAVTKPDVSGVVLDETQVMRYWLISLPAEKDTLVVGTTESIETNIDPAASWAYFSSVLISNLGAPLVYIKPGSVAGPDDFTPGLAARWSYSPDGLTWTFDLKQGLKFSDGTEFTADAVKYSFDRGIGLASDTGPYVGLGYSDMIANVTAPSKYRVVLTLKYPVAWFLALLAFSGSSIVNPEYAPMNKAVDYVEGNAAASNPNDLGPYVLTEWVRLAGKEYEMKLDSNPNYFGASEGYPKVKHIVFRFYSDATSLGLAMRSGDVDMAFRHLTPTDIKNMQTDPSLKVWEGTGGTTMYMAFQEKIPPFDNPKVRQAIAAALDRKELVDTVFLGQAVPLYSMIPMGMNFYEPLFKTLGDGNITFTVSTLRELGYTENATNPASQTWLGVAGVGIVLAVAGAAIQTRKKK